MPNMIMISIILNVMNIEYPVSEGILIKINHFTCFNFLPNEEDF